MARNFRTKDEYEKKFVKIIDQLSYNRQKWQVWEDLMEVVSCTISNAVDCSPSRHGKREKAYLSAIKRIGNADLAARAFSIIVEALEFNPDQDFLGGLYMRLELGSHWHGQFFTPYDICRLCVEMQMPNPKDEAERKGWISICDPAIGGGAMLIAAANHLKREGLNYHDFAMFVGQDIDRVAAQMAYIQLSLLGCPGYIAVANTLSNPITGSVLMPDEKEGQEFWYTPFYFKDTWDMRRRIRLIEAMTAGKPRQAEAGKQQEAQPPKERYVFFFDFTGGAYDRPGKNSAGSIR